VITTFRIPARGMAAALAAAALTLSAPLAWNVSRIAFTSSPVSPPAMTTARPPRRASVYTWSSSRGRPLPSCRSSVSPTATPVAAPVN